MVTYEHFICNIRSLKKEEHRVWLTIGGDKLSYCANLSSPAAFLLYTNIFFNSVISDAHKGDRYGTTDIKNYYLNNPMNKYQYMKIPIQLFTDEIQQEYDISML